MFQSRRKLTQQLPVCAKLETSQLISDYLRRKLALQSFWGVSFRLHPSVVALCCISCAHPQSHEKEPVATWVQPFTCALLDTRPSVAFAAFLFSRTVVLPVPAVCFLEPMSAQGIQTGPWIPLRIAVA